MELLPLVKRVALQVHAHLPGHVELDDLVGDGWLGLLDALRKFDPAQGVKLASYARHRIRGSILDGLRSLDAASRDLRRQRRRAERLYAELEARWGRPVSDEEMAAGLGMELEAWYRLLPELHAAGFQERTPTAAAAAPRRRAEAAEGLALAPPAVCVGPEEACYRREQREILERALACLPPRQRLVMTLYYRQQVKMKEIAARLTVDPSRVSQLRAAALLRLKKHVQAMLHPASSQANGNGLSSI